MVVRPRSRSGFLLAQAALATLGVLLLTYSEWALSDAAAPAPAFGELDYATIRTPTGWTLRLLADGSGCLSHRHYPRHYLHYPPATFNPAPAPAVARGCRRESATTTCARLEYYRAAADQLLHCSCAPAPWVERTVQFALDHTQLAVDDPASERSSRTLRKEFMTTGY